MSDASFVRPPILIGRAPEIARVEALLANNEARVITLWGAGGIGKTSLALRALQDRAPALDLAVFAGLTAARTALDVVASLADPLGVAAPRSRSAEEGLRRVAHSLASRGRALVVLDNAEHVIDHAARMVQELLVAAPHATFLVTSREPLGLRDEIVIEVPPLALPDAGEPVENAAAVQLLLSRARAVRADFHATPALLLEIVRRLDGVPLAIELAAARVDVLGAEELRDRLSERFALLRTNRRDTASHQRALESTIDVSWKLLSEAERRALARLAVAPGELDLAAAEALVGDELGEALDLVQGLVRKSLLHARSEGAGDGARMFGIFESVRVFALASIDSDDDAVRRHAEYFSRAGASLAEAADGAEDVTPIDRLARIGDDLRAIVDRFVARPEGPITPHVALDAACALLPLAHVRGPMSAYAQRIFAVLGAAEDCGADPVDLARARWAAGTARVTLGQLDEALALLTRAVADLRESPEHQRDLARALARQGYVMHELGHYESARVLQRETADISMKIGAKAIAAAALASIGTIEHLTGDHKKARALYVEGIKLARQGKHTAGEGRILAKLGFLDQDEGDIENARMHHRAALALFEKLGDERAAGTAIGYLGNVLRGEGRYAEAREHYDRAVTAMQHVGDRIFEVVFRMDLGSAYLLEGDTRAALPVLRDARAESAETGDRYLKSIAAGYEVAVLALSHDVDSAEKALESARVTVMGHARACLETHATTVKIVRAALHHDRAALDEARAVLDRASGSAPASEHERIARVLAVRALDAAAPPSDALVFDREAGHVRPPGGVWIDLGPHVSARRVCEALVEARIAKPGARVSSAELLAAGWPGERVASRAAGIRVRVAVAQLRKLGLRSLVQSGAGGYLLDPGTRVVLAARA